jgi:uncharacterized protein (UPF0332 family)
MAYDKNVLINYRIDRAKETMKDAKMAIDNFSYHTAENRIYYAIFYIVSALACKYDFATSKHKQLMGWFNFNFIKTNVFPTDLQKIYRETFDNRQESDYADMVEFQKEEVELHFQNMQKFVLEIENYIKSEIKNSNS